MTYPSQGTEPGTPSGPPAAPGYPAPAPYEPPPFAMGAPAVTPSGQRPGSVTGAVLLLGVYAVVYLIVTGFRVVSHVGHPDGLSIGLAIKDVGFLVLVLLGTVLAAVLAIQGRDAGRALALAFSGYAVLAGIGGVLTTAVFTIVGSSGVDLGDIFSIFVTLLMLGVAAVAFLLLLSRSTADWFHERRSAGR